MRKLRRKMHQSQLALVLAWRGCIFVPDSAALRPVSCLPG